MSLPTGVALDSSGNLYFADSLNNRIRKLAGGNVSTYRGQRRIQPFGRWLARPPARSSTLRSAWRWMRAGNLYIADTLNNVVRARRHQRHHHHLRRHRHGRFRRRWRRGYQRAAQRTAGPGGGFRRQSLHRRHAECARAQSLRRHHQHRRRHRHRRLRRRWRGGRQRAAQRAVRRGRGCGRQSLYRRFRQQPRIAKWRTNGTITTLAGTGVSGYGGDGGQATSAQLNGPQAVAVDASGNVYIADTANNRVRKVASNGVITTVAGNGQAGSSGDGGPARQRAGGQPHRARRRCRGQPVHRRWQRARAQALPLRLHQHHRGRRHAATRAMAAARSSASLNGPFCAGHQ